MVQDEKKLRKRIKSGQALHGISNQDMAIKMHLSLPQWERRLSHPGKLTYLELMKIDKILKLKLMN